MNERSYKATRIKACELAAQMMHGQGAADDIGSRLMSLVVFFETYIDCGCDETDKRMKLLQKTRGKRLRVVAGGRL